MENNIEKKLLITLSSLYTIFIVFSVDLLKVKILKKSSVLTRSGCHGNKHVKTHFTGPPISLTCQPISPKIIKMFIGY